ncbi:MAG: glycosyltransferase family 2 protein [Bacteroidota bacterium]|nr:glycosyltransferase family 2 protein [Bacteroidota bacterium]
MNLSVIIPVYNAEKSIHALVTEILTIYTDETEIILVNDGSNDDSETICEKISNENSNVKFISLRKNFGEHNAVLCGLNYAVGNYAVIIDDDFQNPPSQISILLSEIEKGFDVVFSRYHDKRHNPVRNLMSAINNVVANLLMNKPKELYLSSFKIIQKEVVSEIIKYKGPFPYIDGLILRTTNNIGSIYVEHDKRAMGKSNYTFKKLFSLYLNMFLNFSIKPLRIFTVSGFVIFLLGIFLSAYFIISKLSSQEVPGWTSTVLLILLLSGFQIIFLGLMGEYLGKQYMDQNNTPQWVIKKVNLGKSK